MAPQAKRPGMRPGIPGREQPAPAVIGQRGQTPPTTRRRDRHRRLVRDRAGDRPRRSPSRDFAVVLVYLRDPAEADAAVAEIMAAGGTAVAVRADVTDELDVERLFDETAAVFGDVDVVVHGAACGPSRPRPAPSRPAEARRKSSNSSTALLPSTMTPSTGTFSPGLTRRS